MNREKYLTFNKVNPKIADSAFISTNVTIIGDVVIDEHSSIWPGCVIRGDVNFIRIGKYTNIQDGTVVHVDRRNGGETILGSYVTIGHMCLLHACNIADYTFIGMGSIIMDHSVIEKNSMIAAGSLLTMGKIVKSGELWSGRPAKFHRILTQEEIDDIKASADRYFELSILYK